MVRKHAAAQEADAVSGPAAQQVDPGTLGSAFARTHNLLVLEFGDRADFEDPGREWRRLFSELLGTFALVLAAAGGGLLHAKGQRSWHGIRRWVAIGSDDRSLPKLGDTRLEKPVHGFCAGCQDWSQFAPVDHLGGPRARVPRYPRDLLHGDTRAGHQ